MRFCFCFSFAACNYLFSFAKIVALCIASWQPLTSWSNACSDELGGLFGRLLSIDFINEAY